MILTIRAPFWYKNLFPGPLGASLSGKIRLYEPVLAPFFEDTLIGQHNWTGKRLALVGLAGKSRDFRDFSPFS